MSKLLCEGNNHIFVTAGLPSDETQCTCGKKTYKNLDTGKSMRHFYTWASSRNTIPEKYREAIEWFIKSAEEFDKD